ncbi:MAG: methyltransferase domain-containing protein [Chloroflexi bacterium]|nr:methyltransferase domain-containing protein [Chloroflexota bacterium]
MTDLDQAAMWDINRAGWDAAASRFYGAAALPNYGPFAQTEDALGLLGDIRDQAVLEIGCGSGHSLLYLAQQGARELWGVDLSSQQIEFTQALLREHNVSAQLFNAPMETNPGLPYNHFDFAISLYSLGWTTDLDATLALVYAYLKPGGFYVFSWEHPFYSCLEYQPETGTYSVGERYREQTYVKSVWNGAPIVIHQRQMSTFINSALKVGFRIERLIEEVDLTQALEVDSPDQWYSSARAQLVPPTFILKLRKPASGSN